MDVNTQNSQAIVLYDGTNNVKYSLKKEENANKLSDNNRQILSDMATEIFNKNLIHLKTFDTENVEIQGSETSQNWLVKKVVDNIPGRNDIGKFAGTKIAETHGTQVTNTIIDNAVPVIVNKFLNVPRTGID